LRADRASQATELLQLALNHDPRHLEIRAALAEATFRCGRPADAAEMLRELVNSPGGATSTHLNNLALALERLGQQEDSIHYYRRAVAVSEQCAGTNDAAIHSNFLFALNYGSGVSDDEIHAEHLKWAARHSDVLFPTGRVSFRHTLEEHRRLRVGYVSADFRAHTRALFMEGVIAAHNRSQIEVCCYSDVAKPDAVTSQIEALADLWRDTHRLSHASLAELISHDRIDVLVDLTGHMSNNRLLVFSRRPAPVQIAYPGYPGTTAVRAIDALICDSDRIPAGCERWYREQVIRIPVSSQCYRPDPSSPAVDPVPPSLRPGNGGRITFACFNKPVKITPVHLLKWARLLRSVPGSRLLVLAGADPAKRQDGKLLQRLTACGISSAQAELVPPLPRTAYLARYGHVDIALDTSPYNGHTTTLDAAWTGVPTVTLVGQNHRSREGLAVARHLGLTDLAASTPEEYIAVAERLAKSPTRLAQLRAELRGRLARSALMDFPRLANALENVYRSGWKHFCRRVRSAS
jgi:predicted O-linked N-acetylglucosamine transferase (SPINDLY family)